MPCQRSLNELLFPTPLIFMTKRRMRRWRFHVRLDRLMTLPRIKAGERCDD
jgi:hypothetical protein